MAAGWQPSTLPLEVSDVPVILAEHSVLVVYFWAPWNGVDRKFSPVIDVVRPEFEGRIVFRSVNIDNELLTDFCIDCEVVNVPALGCFVGGRRITTIIGLQGVDELRAEFATLLGEPLALNQTQQHTTRQEGFLSSLQSLWRRLSGS